MEIANILRRSTIIPVVKIRDSRDIIFLTRALVAAGISSIELMWQKDILFDCIHAITDSMAKLTVGVCGITDPEQFEQTKIAGGHYATSIGLTPALKAAAEAANIPYLPGVMTACEIMAAREMGYRILKFFPAEIAGGIKALKAFQPVFADVYFCPAGGITRANMQDYLSLSNVLAVSSSWITPENLLQMKNWDAIRTLAREVTQSQKSLIV